MALIRNTVFGPDLLSDPRVQEQLAIRAATRPRPVMGGGAGGRGRADGLREALEMAKFRESEEGRNFRASLVQKGFDTQRSHDAQQRELDRQQRADSAAAKAEQRRADFEYKVNQALAKADFNRQKAERDAAAKAAKDAENQARKAQDANKKEWGSTVKGWGKEAKKDIQTFREDLGKLKPESGAQGVLTVHKEGVRDAGDNLVLRQQMQDEVSGTPKTGPGVGLLRDREEAPVEGFEEQLARALPYKLGYRLNPQEHYPGSALWALNKLTGADQVDLSMDLPGGFRKVMDHFSPSAKARNFAALGRAVPGAAEALVTGRSPWAALLSEAAGHAQRWRNEEQGMTGGSNPNAMFQGQEQAELNQNNPAYLAKLAAAAERAGMDEEALAFAERLREILRQRGEIR